MDIKKYIFDNKYNFLIILLWTFIVIYVSLYHELWYDETVSYHMVKTFSLKNLINIISTYEGHPPLWYILEYPFAKLGFSPVIIQIISFISVFAIFA